MSAAVVLSVLLIIIVLAFIGFVIYHFVSKEKCDAPPDMKYIGLAYKAKNETVESVMQRIQGILQELQLQGCVMFRKDFQAKKDEFFAKIDQEEKVPCEVARYAVKEFIKSITEDVPDGIKMEPLGKEIKKLWDLLVTSTCEEESSTLSPTRMKELINAVIDSVCYA
jgi:hypothetical protein